MKRSVVCLLILCLCLGIVTTTGCGGCRSDEDGVAEKKKKDKEKKKEKPRPDYESPGTAILPGNFPDLETPTIEEFQEMTNEERAQLEARNFLRRNRTKVGHWVATSTPVRANHFNVQGRLDVANVISARPAEIPGTRFTFATARPFALTKGQWKYLQSSAWLVPRSKASQASVQLDLLPAAGGAPLFGPPMCINRLMKGFQYHMVLLTNREQKMKYLNLTDSVAVKDTRAFSDVVSEFYFIVSNEPDNPIPLPSNALQWTTIAYVVWDDLDPDSLDIDQQQALLDWLHFGGQLILSGPDCLSKLENSFLAQYLPAQSAERTEIEKNQFEALNENWSVPNAKNSSDKRHLTITEGNPLVGIELLPHVDARFVDGTGELVVERALGRGRIVATAFSLAEPRVKSWPSFQTFFSGALLRRPRRQFGRKQDERLSFRWVDDTTSIFDSLVGSTLRFTSRDLGVADRGTTTAGQDEVGNAQKGLDGGGFDPFDSDDMVELSPVKGKPGQDLENTRFFGGFKENRNSGVAGWSDHSTIANAARSTLKNAAGIKPPSAGLVLKMLGVYLLVLVPVNWLLFRLIGKVEWAWFAIPFIAIAGALAVVRVAALDIGFARSNSQIGLLELQPEYRRGHLTQYSALYTSLSTKYDVELDNASGIALPFPSGGAKKEKTTQHVTLHQSIENRLENFLIQSNSTRMMHAECLFDAGGSFELASQAADSAQEHALDFSQPITITNGTQLALISSAVVGRDESGNYHMSWLGDWEGQRQKTVQLSACRREEILKSWESPSPADDAEVIGPEPADAANISASKFLEAVVKHLRLGKGELRLLGYCNDRVGNNHFIPESTQTRQQTLVLAHLKPAILPPARRDVNSILDFLSKRTLVDDGSSIDANFFNAEESQ